MWAGGRYWQMSMRRFFGGDGVKFELFQGSRRCIVEKVLSPAKLGSLMNLFAAARLLHASTCVCSARLSCEIHLTK
jgi:hypothetical protein